ncbi:MAG: pyruvate kinase [Roseburia sp.]|nr:pyruvate kinase [Roseburia sp.]
MRTKVYGTVGPACCDTEVLAQLFKKGMTGIRINLSHVNLVEVTDWIENIRTAYAMVKKENPEQAELEMLIDLIGPEMRLGELLSERKLNVGDKLTVMAEGKTNLFDPTELPIPKPVFDSLEEGTAILIDDGKILLEVEEKRSRAAECVVMRGGTLRSEKSIAIPGVVFETPTLTESDIDNIRRAKEYGITGVMLPFVRGKEDLCNLEGALEEVGAADMRVYAKIENELGVQKIEELLPFCDEIVIARGDLGNAISLWDLPVVQAKIAKICNAADKPFMIATQMLASMEYAAVPTRAEVSDIYRAVSEGATSVILTGETAAGKYPVESIEYMVKTVQAAEEYVK